MRVHTCAFTEITIDPDYRSCGYSGCSRIKRVVIVLPAKAVESSQTSKDAARAIGPRRRALRVAVYRAILANPDGLTDERGIEITGIDPSTYRPRRVELVESGVIRDSGKTRLTKSGRSATIWVAVSDLPTELIERSGVRKQPASSGRGTTPGEVTSVGRSVTV